MNLRQFISSIAVAGTLIFSSCSAPKNIAYFQDRVNDSPEKIDKHAGIVIEPKDMLSIVISSRNPELAAMFNLPVVSYQAGSEMVSSGGQLRLMGYSVDNEGYIDFPILGKLDVAGKTRWELSDMIKTRLEKEGLLAEPIVTVEFMNFKVSVLGEVNSPGILNVEGDKFTVLDAISHARDLTIFGKRENVSVIREEDGKRTIYQINLCSVDMFKSPAYYLKQNDIVYVEPSAIKSRQSTVDDKSLRITSIMISSGSLLASVTSLIVSIILNTSNKE